MSLNERSEHDSKLFAGTAKFYSKYRLGYPDELFDKLKISNANLMDFPVLDLGCGTGHVAFGLAKRGMTVFAVDPDPDMLAEGIRSASELELSPIRWMLGTDKQIGDLDLPPLSVCAMGASFHWMDRDKVLDRLDQMIVPLGCVAIFSGKFDLEHSETRSWNTVTTEAIKQFLGTERRAGSGTYMHPKRRHAQVLRSSVFDRIETYQFEKRFSLSIDDIIGLQLSMSFASTVQLGDKLNAFKSALSEALAEVTTEPIFESVMQYELIIGRR
jgi:SAM-dependent methyltransferase